MVTCKFIMTDRWTLLSGSKF